MLYMFLTWSLLMRGGVLLVVAFSQKVVGQKGLELGSCALIAQPQVPPGAATCRPAPSKGVAPTGPHVRGGLGHDGCWSSCAACTSQAGRSGPTGRNATAGVPQESLGLVIEN